MSAPAAYQAERLKHLDGLRGLACLMVALSHFVIAFFESWMSGAPETAHNAWDPAVGHSPLVLFYNPRLGVAIFFVLSGYVLAASVAWRQPPLWCLALRRWLRLCLPIIAMTLLAYLALHLGAFRGVNAAAGLAKTNWLPAFYGPVTYLIPLSLCLRNIFFTFFTGSPGAVQNLIGTLWTMPIELVGSLVLFMGYCAGADIFRRSRGCFAVALILVFWTWRTRYAGFGIGVALFEIGRGISYLPVSMRDWTAKLAPIAGVTSLAVGLWVAATPFAPAGTHLWFLEESTAFGIQVQIGDMNIAGAGLLVVAALLCRAFQRVLNSAPCQYLGRISYMLYLVQNPVECSAGVFIFLHAPNPYNLRAGLTLLGYLAVSVALADVTTRLIDRPAIRLSRLATAQGITISNLPTRALQALTDSA